MKATEDESAALKQALKHSPLTAELAEEAAANIGEASEAVDEVEQGFDTCSEGSYVAAALAGLL